MFKELVEGLKKTFSDVIAQRLAAVAVVSLAAISGVGVSFAHMQDWVVESGVTCQDGKLQTQPAGSVTLRDSFYNAISKLVLGRAVYVIDGLEGGQVHIVVDDYDDKSKMLSGTLYCSDHEGPLSNVVAVQRLPKNKIRILGCDDKGACCLDLLFVTKHTFAEEMVQLFADVANITRWETDADSTIACVNRLASETGNWFSLSVGPKKMRFRTLDACPHTEVVNLIDESGVSCGNGVLSLNEYGVMHMVVVNSKHKPEFTLELNPVDLRVEWGHESKRKFISKQVVDRY